MDENTILPGLNNFIILRIDIYFILECLKKILNIVADYIQSMLTMW